MGNQSTTRRYTADALGNITSISDSTFGSHSYEYDYRGFLTKADGETYEYDGNGNITKKGNINFVYDENNMLYGFIKDNTEKYLYVRDNLQNIIAISTLLGEIVVKYNYDAWGKLLSTTGSWASTIGSLNPFRYKGYYYDQESGMYYCKSRYYVSDWCRWPNADNPNYLEYCKLTNCNIFAYCENDPILDYDPNGTWNWKKFWKGVGRDY